MYFYSSNFCSPDYQAYLELLQQMKTLKQKNFELQESLKECENKISIISRQNELLRSKQTDSKICHLKREQESSPDYITQKKKTRKRKRNDNIDNIFDCPYKNCVKAYGTSLALNLHIKLKHNGGSKKQRQRLAKRIIDAEERGQEIPRFSIDFPPNYIEVIGAILRITRNYWQPKRISEEREWFDQFQLEQFQNLQRVFESYKMNETKQFSQSLNNILQKYHYFTIK